jgi:hypothetical protein
MTGQLFKFGLDNNTSVLPVKYVPKAVLWSACTVFSYFNTIWSSVVRCETMENESIELRELASIKKEAKAKLKGP